MSPRLTVSHTHQPVYRVVRRSWADPLDSSHSQRRRDNRWNTPEFPALYCCCSERVARAAALDVLRLAGIVMEDLEPAYQPQLVEIKWSGLAADVASAKGVAEAGFPPEYPAGVDGKRTRDFATACHDAGDEGIVCRSASLARMGNSTWEGPHEGWGEVAIFPLHSQQPVALVRRRADLKWFLGL